MKASSTSATHSSHASHSSASEEHLENLGGIDASSHAAEACALVSIVVDLAGVVHLLLLGIGEAAVGLCDFLELARGFLLLSLALVSVAVGMVLEGEAFVGLLDLLVGGISVDFQDFVVVLLLGLLLLLLGLLDLGAEVDAGVEFLDLVVVHDGGGVLSAFHVEVCPAHEGLVVVGVEFEGLVEVVERLEGLLALDEGECAVGVDDRVELLVGGIQVDGLRVLLLRLLELPALDELVPLLLQLLASLGSVQRQPTLLVVGIQSHPLREELLGSRTLAAVELNDALQVPEVWGLLFESDAGSLEESEGFCGLAGLGEALDLAFLEFFVLGDLVDEVVDAGERLCEIALLSRRQVAFVVGLQALRFLELVPDGDVLLVVEGGLEGVDGLSEAEDLLAGESLPAEGLGEGGLEGEAGLAVGDALEVLSEVGVGGGAVGVVAVVLGVQLDGLGVGEDRLLVVLGREGRVAFLLPVLRGLLDVHLTQICPPNILLDIYVPKRLQNTLKPHRRPHKQTNPHGRSCLSLPLFSASVVI